MQVRQVLFSGARIDARAANLGLLLLRVFTGLALAFAHGLGKVPPSERFIARVDGMGLPAPELFAWLAAATEFGGGLLLAAGLLTRPTAFIIAGNMAVIVLLAQAGEPFQEQEKALLFGMAAVLYLFTGAGRYGLDALVTGRRATPAFSRRRGDGR
jgi:putative oxidoreductase